MFARAQKLQQTALALWQTAADGASVSAIERNPNRPWLPPQQTTGKIRVQCKDLRIPSCRAHHLHELRQRGPRVEERTLSQAIAPLLAALDTKADERVRVHIESAAWRLRPAFLQPKPPSTPPTSHQPTRNVRKRQITSSPPGRSIAYRPTGTSVKERNQHPGCV